MRIIKLLSDEKHKQTTEEKPDYITEYGTHFNEHYARKAVANMQNEDNTVGPHWTVEETTALANQVGVNLNSGKHNKWDWYVAMNMVYSDFYKALVSITGSANVKHFAELSKAWICDKDISDGKMWHYYTRIIKDCEGFDETEYEEVKEVIEQPKQIASKVRYF